MVFLHRTLGKLIALVDTFMTLKLEKSQGTNIEVVARVFVPRILLLFGDIG